MKFNDLRRSKLSRAFPGGARASAYHITRTSHLKHGTACTTIGYQTNIGDLQQLSLLRSAWMRPQKLAWHELQQCAIKKLPRTGYRKQCDVRHCAFQTNIEDRPPQVGYRHKEHRCSIIGGRSKKQGTVQKFMPNGYPRPAVITTSLYHYSSTRVGA